LTPVIFLGDIVSAVLENRYLAFSPGCTVYMKVFENVLDILSGDSSFFFGEKSGLRGFRRCAFLSACSIVKFYRSISPETN
jgi:hypothetical protein